MTLYRVGRNSPIVEALLEAIENGKQVAVLVELKARFDEESNIEWAESWNAKASRRLRSARSESALQDRAGRAPAKATRIRRYVHLGTGNYNPAPRASTPISACSPATKRSAPMSPISSTTSPATPRKIDTASCWSRPSVCAQRLEAPHPRAKSTTPEAQRDGHLIFKMNALEDRGMIQLLYEASQAGVQIDLIVRGICCLRPGVPGVSENIRVAASSAASSNTAASTTSTTAARRDLPRQRDLMPAT